MADEYSVEFKANVGAVYLSYMKLILFRTARDYIEAEKNRKERYVFLEDVSYNEKEPSAEFEEFVSRTKSNYHLHLQNPLLSEGIHNLADADREVLFMLYYDMMTTTDVAEILGVSQQAISKKRGKLLRELADGLQNL